MEQPAEQTHSYKVMVDDNFHYMDESERYQLAEFNSCAAAISACKKLVDDYLLSAYIPDMTPDQLLVSYLSFGEDPFIISTDEQCSFSARDYARQRYEVLCQPRYDEAEGR